MHLHEFQTKELLQKAGIAVPAFIVISKIEELENLRWDQTVLKAQVHAGGRGKAGGVKFARNKEEALILAKKLLGLKIINEQTGKEGITCRQILISPTVSIKKEYYLGAIIDRHQARAMLMASSDGGVDIEEIAAKTPEKIISVPIMPDGTLKSYHLIRLMKGLNWAWHGDDPQVKPRIDLIQKFAKLFMQSDASLLEINPLIETEEGHMMALDAKMTLDENALFRQSRLASYDDETQRAPQEVRAKRHDLTYIAMEGTIGCMVNGAGLAMATLDIIHHYGGLPANFLDVGGSASQEKVAAGFDLILSDPKVLAILVNIFGGIMNCMTIAAAIIAVASAKEVPIPLIIRMEGTNVEQAKKMLKDSGLNIILATDLTDAAQKAVYYAHSLER